MKTTSRLHSFLAFGLAVCMAALTLTSCGSSASKKSSSATNSTEVASEPVTLRIYCYDNASTDDSKVAEAISELPEVKTLSV